MTAMELGAMGGRKVICGDALVWLRANVGLGPVVTSPPDFSEVEGWEWERWRFWFAECVRVCITTAGENPAVFYVTDRRDRGELTSKAEVVFSEARAAGRVLLWHKVALRSAVGVANTRRRGFSHLIAVGREGTRPGWPQVDYPHGAPDVFDGGRQLWRNGMGEEAARVAVSYVAGVGPGPVVNPFCGQGTVLAAATRRGLPAVGIDIEPEQCSRAAWAS